MEHIPFDFKNEWRLISDDPCPTRKLCRQVVRVISNLRQEYLYVLKLIAYNYIIDDILDENEDGKLYHVKAQVSDLLYVGQVLWDIHEFRPQPLRQRRKLLKLIQKIRKDSELIDELIEQEKCDLEIFYNTRIGDHFIPFQSIRNVPSHTPSYYRWQLS